MSSPYCTSYAHLRLCAQWKVAARVTLKFVLQERHQPLNSLGGQSISFDDLIFSHIRYRGSYHVLSWLSSLDQKGPDTRHFISDETPEKCFREVASTRKVYGKKWRDFLWPEIFVRFEKHPKVVSGALRDGFRARDVFGSFEKRTPEHKRMQTENNKVQTIQRGNDKYIEL